VTTGILTTEQPFSTLLNVCSAASAPRTGDRDARDRLVEAAIALIGDEGVRAATVRRVADLAGVSAPLVLHHFGSKDGLVAACDDEVLARVELLVATLNESGAEGALQQLLTSTGMASSMVYIGRSLLDDGDVGREWFNRLYEMTRHGMDEMAASGTMRPVADQPMVAVLLLAMDLGVVLLRPHIERILDVDLTEGPTTQRWATAEFDLLSEALLRRPAHPDEPGGAP
jgi:AcrR family transcriptional regulator